MQHHLEEKSEGFFRWGKGRGFFLYGRDCAGWGGGGALNVHLFSRQIYKYIKGKDFASGLGRMTPTSYCGTRLRHRPPQYRPFLALAVLVFTKAS